MIYPLSSPTEFSEWLSGRHLRMKWILGSNIFTLLLAVVTEAKPAVIPVTENTAVAIPSETILLGILAINLIQAIWWLVKQIIGMFKNDHDELKSTVNETAESVHRMEEQISHLFSLIDEKKIKELIEEKVELHFFRQKHKEKRT